jgi:hypothetical protein
MSKPSAFELQLIQKITIASCKIEDLKRIHSDTCPAKGPRPVVQCTCGVDQFNAKVDIILSDLKIE